MIVAIHQPNYLPHLGFFHKLGGCDVFIVYDVAQFSKNDFHNRNKIKTPRGPLWITVPVRAPHAKPLRAIEIDNSTAWPEKHALSLRANYSRTQHFRDFYDPLTKILTGHWDGLSELNVALIRQIKDWLDLPAELVLSSSLNPPEGLKASERILWLVRAVGGSAYLSGPGGRDYLEPRKFEDLQLVYDLFRSPSYPQLFGEFVPNLSVVDTLFNCGAKGTRSLLAAPLGNGLALGPSESMKENHRA